MIVPLRRVTRSVRVNDDKRPAPAGLSFYQSVGMTFKRVRRVDIDQGCIAAARNFTNQFGMGRHQAFGAGVAGQRFHL